MKFLVFAVQAWLWKYSSTMMRFISGAITALMMLGCMSRYSPEALQRMAPGAEYAEVCVRPPTVRSDRPAFAHNVTLQRTISDEDWEEFEQFAKTADIIYRYDPHAPPKTASRLPWPYHTMSCSPLVAPKAPPLREGMHEITISDEMREALASALIDKASLSLRKPEEREETTSRFNGLNKQYLGGGFVMGPYVDGRSTQERLEATGQMLRDAIRAVLPKVPGPKDEQISIIDTDAGQVIGGAGAGATITWVPGGVFIADAMENSPRVQQPTLQFKFGQGLGQMGSSLLQIGGGTTLAAGGVGMSATGVGLVAGIPTCTAGVILVANGTITFLHGAHTVLVAACNWHELDNAEPLAAAAPKDVAGPPAPPPQANAAPAPAAAPVQAAPAKPVVTPAKPAATPAKPAVKPAANPAKTAAKTTSTSGQTVAQTAKQCRALISSTPSTTTWRRCTGQMHHAISKTIHKALEEHNNLKGIYKARDDRFVTQAIDDAAHKGYQKWHRDLDEEIAKWIRKTDGATPKDFEAYLRQRYSEAKLKAIFPNGL